jgi:hypothetical protein
VGQEVMKDKMGGVGVASPAQSHGVEVLVEG